MSYADLKPGPMPQPLPRWYWRIWLLLTLVATVFWCVAWHRSGVMGAIPYDEVLFSAFIVPELLAAFINVRYTLTSYLWTFHWFVRYLIGLWLGTMITVALYTWFGIWGAALGGVIFVWLSTPHLIAKRDVI